MAGFYVQEKVRPGTGREAGLGHERYIAIEHMEKVRAGTAREASLGCVRRDCFEFAQGLMNHCEGAPTLYS